MSPAIRNRIIAEARGWIGTPYMHQASLKGVGCDCLGLLRGVWRAIHGTEPEPLPAYAPDWAEASGEERLAAAARRHLIEIDSSEAAPGDVLLFRWRPHLPAKHAAIASGDDRISTPMTARPLPKFTSRRSGGGAWRLCFAFRASRVEGRCARELNEPGPVPLVFRNQ